LAGVEVVKWTGLSPRPEREPTPDEKVKKCAEAKVKVGGRDQERTDKAGSVAGTVNIGLVRIIPH